jgi:hypothetical protein
MLTPASKLDRFLEYESKNPSPNRTVRNHAGAIRSMGLDGHRRTNLESTFTSDFAMAAYPELGSVERWHIACCRCSGIAALLDPHLLRSDVQFLIRVCTNGALGKTPAMVLNGCPHQLLDAVSITGST